MATTDYASLPEHGQFIYESSIVLMGSLSFPSAVIDNLFSMKLRSYSKSPLNDASMQNVYNALHHRDE